MRIKVSRSKNSNSYFVIKDIYRNNKRTTKVVKVLGNDQDILSKYPNVDPYTWAKEYAKKLTLEEKESNRSIIAKYNPTKQIELNKQTLFNSGYLFLQSIYHELKLDKICREITQKYNFEYDLNEILSRLLYLRILHPTSKKEHLNIRNIYWNLHIFSHIKSIEPLKFWQNNPILSRKRFIKIA